jgi:hypothetical protein
LRNVFDQYSQPENRVTHALMTAIDEDRNLLGHFLRELVKVRLPTEPHKLSVLEQQYPGEEEPSEDELERRGIPDGWIYDNEGWCVLIESKVIAKLTADQIHRHRRTAERRGFESIAVVAITPHKPTALPPQTVLLEWRTVYAWLRRHSSRSMWATRAADYLEVAEAKLIDSEQFVEGTLTQFSGFPFGLDHPFTYLEGKRVLGLAMNELRGHRDLKAKLGMNPKASGRGAITGSQGDLVWDFLSLSAAASGDDFTNHPHLTLGVGTQVIDAMVTIPNGVNTGVKQRLKELDEPGFQKLAKQAVKNLSPMIRKHAGAVPWFRGVQRRFPSRRGVPHLDARIEFDLRTAFASGGLMKLQPRWLSAAYGSFVNKEGSNYEIQMGVIFRYDRCPELRQADAVELIASAWLACKPLVDLTRGSKQSANIS